VKDAGGEPVLRDDAAAAMTTQMEAFGSYSVVVPVYATEPSAVPRIVESLMAIVTSAMHYSAQVCRIAGTDFAWGDDPALTIASSRARFQMLEQTGSLNSVEVGELILVDDASPDSLFDSVWEHFMAISAAALSAHPGALHIPPPLRLPANLGAGAARNAGIQWIPLVFHTRSPRSCTLRRPELPGMTATDGEGATQARRQPPATGCCSVTYTTRGFANTWPPYWNLSAPALN
jgi:hypothetical protein